jgi:hypothetical protein
MQVKVRKVLVVTEANRHREYKTADKGARAIASQIARRLEKRYNTDMSKRNSFKSFAYDKAYRRVLPIVEEMMK